MGIWRETKYILRRFGRIQRLEESFKNNLKLFRYACETAAFPEYLEPEVSIIIPFYNQKNYTEDCLFSIFKNLPEISFEIILIDDNSNEPYDFSNFENIRIVKNFANLGFLGSVNKGIRESKGKFIYLLNNDTQVYAGFLDELKYVFDHFENAGAVGSMLLNADGSLQEAGSVFLSDGQISQVVGKKKPFDPEFNFIYKVDYCSGCSLMFKKFKDNGEVNLFDIQFSPAYFEDTDICFNLRYLQKKEIYYTPFSKVVHFNGVSYNSETALNTKKQQLFEKNFHLFKNKWMKEMGEVTAAKPQDRLLYLNGGQSVVFYNGMVPEFDKYSGELRLAEIIEAFKAKGFYVVIIAEKNKIEFKYNEYFQRRGICVYYEHRKSEGRQAFLKRLRLKKPVSWFYSVKIFKKDKSLALRANRDTKLVFDMVDIHHLRHKRACGIEPNRISHRKNYIKFLLMEISASKQADIVVAISEQEAEYMAKYISREKISVISNIHYLKKKRDKVPGFAERADLLFVGSSHPPNVDAVKFLEHEIMPKVWAINSNIKLSIVGNVSEAMQITHDHIEVFGYVKDMESFLLNKRIMVAPLRYGAGVKGKIGQAFEYHLPVITTSIGAEGMQLTDGENALIAETAEEFAEKIIQLYHDENLWMRLQRNSESSLKPFSKENLTKRIEEIENS